MIKKRYAQILEITRNAGCRRLEITIGIYDEKSNVSWRFGPDDIKDDPDEVMMVYIKDSQIRGLAWPLHLDKVGA